MTHDDVWRIKSDEEVRAALAVLAAYTDAGRDVIRREAARRELSDASSQFDGAEGMEPGQADETTLPVSRARLGRLWRGELRLSESFWLWGVATKIVLGLVTGLALGVDLGVSLLLVGLALALWSSFTCVGIWRSAKRYSGSIAWAVLARIFAVIDVVRSFLIVAIAVHPP